ncbi:MAG: SAM-dependent methyltransferase [Acidimicrobiales bacterium]
MNLAERIRHEIEASGPIPFSRYMELCLYDPTDGFYASGGAGRRRDFITSPEIGPLFGQLVAVALDRCWVGLGEPEHITFVDVGAGPGTLARSIIAAQPRCLPALEYVAVEVSQSQRELHPDGIRSTASLPEDIETGVIFANELLDNLPFDIASFEPVEGWSDVRVGVDGDRLVEVLSPVAAPTWVTHNPVTSVRIPVQQAARMFVAEASEALSVGKIVVVDYAVPAYPTDPDRTWLRTYRDHGEAKGVLDDPGTQDITADVDLAGLENIRRPSRVITQAQWLQELGVDDLVDAGRDYWQRHAARPDLRAMEMRSRIGEAAALVDPRGLGGFSVIEWESPV